VGRAIDEFVSWMENPAGYGSRTAAWTAKSESRPRSRLRSQPAPAPASESSELGGVALSFPVRPGFLAQVMVPADLTVDEARRMGAFLLTLAPDFRPG
jgi:hypothetical protein